MNKGSTSHFRKLISHWSQMGLPLRPLSPLPEHLGSLLPRPDAKVLNLGVTPDHYELGGDLTALDWSAEMIEHVWPGDTESRRAVQGDWRQMPFDDASFDAVTGDNCLAMLAFPGCVAQALAEARRMLRPGGQAIFRVFLAAEPADDDAALRAFGLAGCEGSMDALRWRMVMAQSDPAGDANVRVGDGFALLDRLFSRDELTGAHGFTESDFARLEVYRDSETRFSFPTRARMETLAGAHFSRVEFLPSGTYPLADAAPYMRLTP
ncbi:class I SAM-dependent methyltransferase [Vannielia litorea]|uniref:class I SAM-dependent methyltransferase n=1 Tax=Vannielia litorea TaxID=1217970 RepID=UPI001C981544|nr:class I SAM-dependent methyltransferase [Vannielia litorea]MBY6153566.1 class I SAM-dependent methyltransferase [Vannielia litorea]